MECSTHGMLNSHTQCSRVHPGPHRNKSSTHLQIGLFWLRWTGSSACTAIRQITANGIIWITALTCNASGTSGSARMAALRAAAAAAACWRL
eukprot:1161364-Pelagomonas_calceolata.AAC.9